MSLAEFIAATQAEMKSRIEDECRKQMLALLEDSFSKKWVEYTDKAVTSVTAAPLYSDQYGKLDFSSSKLDDYIRANTSVDLKAILSSQQALFEFSSKKVYFIHCCVKLSTQSHSSGSSTTMDAYLIDNYGFYHQITASLSGGGYRHPNSPVKIDITKPVGSENYTYPLSNSLIDLVKALPSTVDPAYNHSSSYSNNNPGGSLQSIIKNLPELRKTAAIFNEHTIAFDTLRKENEMLKARLRAIEAASPSEDLLGLETAAATSEDSNTEPSRLVSK